MNKRFKKPTEAQVKARALATATEYASITGVPTKAVRTPDGIIRFQHADWPMVGVELARADAPKELDRAA